MADIQTAYQFTAIGTSGTVTVLPNNTVLRSVFSQGTFAGTVAFHDAIGTAGTTATSQIISLGLPATSIPYQLQLNVQCRNGLTYIATGTPVLTFTWGY